MTLAVRSRNSCTFCLKQKGYFLGYVCRGGPAEVWVGVLTSGVFHCAPSCVLLPCPALWVGPVLSAGRQQWVEPSGVSNTMSIGQDRSVPMVPSWRGRKLLFQKPWANLPDFLLAFIALVSISESVHGDKAMRYPLAYIWISELVTNKVMRLPLGQPACISSGFWG